MWYNPCPRCIASKPLLQHRHPTPFCFARKRTASTGLKQRTLWASAPLSHAAAHLRQKTRLGMRSASSGWVLQHQHARALPPPPPEQALWLTWKGGGGACEGDDHTHPLKRNITPAREIGASLSLLLPAPSSLSASSPSPRRRRLSKFAL
jgi:hypothetical protein